MFKIISSYMKNNEGGGLIEYGLIIGLIALACITELTNVGANVKAEMSTIAGKITNVVG